MIFYLGEGADAGRAIVANIVQNECMTMTFYLGEGADAGGAVVANIMQNDHHRHEDGIARRDDVERGTPRILCPKHGNIFSLNIFLGRFFFFFFVLNSALLHLPPLRFPCADGCWIEPRTVPTGALAVRRSNH
jgi:hypothetical protein